MSVAVAEEMQFKWYAPPLQKSTYELNEDGTLTIEGIASTTNKDLQGDIVLPEAIESMKQQLLSTTKNLHGDHEYKLFEGIIGAIKEVIETDSDSLKIKAIIRSKFASEIKEMLDIGINLGLSIGGRIIDYNPLKNGGWEIKDINLLEISLTGMPANWDTFGTITTSKNTTVIAKCLTGACQVIRKNMETKNMSDGNNGNPNEGLTTEQVKDLFNELMASEKQNIKSEILEEVKNDIDKLVADKVEELTNNPTPAPGNEGNEGGVGEKSLEELFKEFSENQEGKLEKAIDEAINKYVKNPSNRDPTPTKKPTNKNNSGNGDEDNGGEGSKKSYTNQEIFKRMKAQKKANSLFNKLGVNVED